MEQQVFIIIFQLIVLIYSVVIHEVAHGVMAYSLGDSTAKHLGRLTLNPFKHLDMFGSFLLPLSFSGTILPQLLSFVVVVNLMLAIFNLFPIPPLDGHWLLLALLPSRYSNLVAFLYRNSILLMVVFIIFIFPRIYPLVIILFRLLTGTSI